MSDNKTEEFLQKLAPCIERGELDACVEAAARVAGEMGVGAEELLELSSEKGKGGRYDFTYVLALVAAQGLEGENKATAYNNAGLASKYLNKAEKAEEHYKQAIAADPNYADAHNNYANLLSELKRNDEAEEHYKQAIAANPNDADAHNNYANLLSELKRNDEAEEHYKQAIVANPNFAKAYHNYARLLQGLNRKNEAEEQYKKAIELDPNEAWYCNDYANFLSDLGKTTEAEEHYKKAIDLNPDLKSAHYNYANLLRELDRKIEAEKHYKIAIKIDPEYAWAHIGYAILLGILGRKNEAEEHHKKAIEIKPDVWAYYNYAYLLAELGRKTEAEEHYKKAIEKDPYFVDSYNNYAILLREKAQSKLVIFLRKKERLLIEAEATIRTSLEKEPTNFYAHKTLGDILSDEEYFGMAEGEYEDALKNLASIENASISDAHNKLGGVYVKLKQYGKAKKEFKKAIDFDPMNIKARRNIQKLDKIIKKTEDSSSREISKAQIFFATVVSAYLIVYFYLFLTTTNKITDVGFTAQSTVLIALLILILFYRQFKTFKFGTGGIEVEKSEPLPPKS